MLYFSTLMKLTSYAVVILGRLRRVDLIISIWGSDDRPPVRTYVRMYVRPSVRPSKNSFSDSDEIWYVGRGR